MARVLAMEGGVGGKANLQSLGQNPSIDIFNFFFVRLAALINKFGGLLTFRIPVHSDPMKLALFLQVQFLF